MNEDKNSEIFNIFLKEGKVTSEGYLVACHVTAIDNVKSIIENGLVPGADYYSLIKRNCIKDMVFVSLYPVWIREKKVAIFDVMIRPNEILGWKSYLEKGKKKNYEISLKKVDKDVIGSYVEKQYLPDDFKIPEKSDSKLDK